MRFKNLTILLLIWLISLTLSAQNPESEAPKLKDFGKSLQKNPASNQNAAADKSDNDEDVIKVETKLVAVDVLVIDASGKVVKGIDKTDFMVSEDNVSQEIGTFSLGNSSEVARSIVLIIDYSGSQIPYLQTSIEAAKILVDKLNPKDRMAIVTDDVDLIAEFTRDKRLLKEKLDSIYDNVKNGEFVETEFKNGKLGKSLQYSALLASLNELFDDEDIRPIVIFQTDGDQFYNIKSHNIRDFEPNTSYQPEFSIEDLFDKVERSRATIYSIISGFSLIGLSQEQRLSKTAKITEELWKSGRLWKPETKRFSNYVERLYGEQTSMESIAQKSGGFAESLETPAQAGQIYSRIFDGISDRYLIGYYPTNQKPDGKRRKVKIEVKNHPEYLILGRKFYYPKPSANPTQLQK
jgi:VWFA-related protein